MFRLFSHLGAHGYDWDTVRTGPLTLSLLSDYKVLFINLVHDGCPPFSPPESHAIAQFVQAGGGLLVLADHTNVYGHAATMNPVLSPFGIQIAYTAALEPVYAQHFRGRLDFGEPFRPRAPDQ